MKKQRQRTKQQWERIIRRYEKSGLSKEEFVSSKGLNMSSFKGWLRKIRQEKIDAKGTSGQFVEIVQPQHTQDISQQNEIKISIENATLEFKSLPEPSWIAQVIVLTKRSGLC